MNCGIWIQLIMFMNVYRYAACDLHLKEERTNCHDAFHLVFCFLRTIIIIKHILSECADLVEVRNKYFRSDLCAYFFGV